MPTFVTTRGRSMTPSLDIAEVARRVRGEIKQRFLHLKASVRISRYSGGESLYVDVLSDATDDEMDGIVEIVEAYNFDRSGYNNDYTHNNFFQTVKRHGVEGFWGRRCRHAAEEWSRVMGWNQREVQEAEEPVNWSQEGF